MAAQIGQFALAFAWVITAYSIIASLLGIRFKNDSLIASGSLGRDGVFTANQITAKCASKYEKEKAAGVNIATKE